MDTLNIKGDKKMIVSKIRVTDAMREILRKKRMENNISGADLSKKIDQTKSYISALENKRIKNIPADTLIRIVKILYSIDNDQEAINKIKGLQSINPHINNIPDINDTEPIDPNMAKELANAKIHKYNTAGKNPNIETQIDIFTDIFKKILRSASKEDEAQTSLMIRILIKDFTFDAGFMFAIFEAPFFAFKPFNFDERQEFLTAFQKLFNQYFMMAKSKKAESEKTSKPVPASDKPKSEN